MTVYTPDRVDIYVLFGVSSVTLAAYTDAAKELWPDAKVNGHYRSGEDPVFSVVFDGGLSLASAAEQMAAFERCIAKVWRAY